MDSDPVMFYISQKGLQNERKLRGLTLKTAKIGDVWAQELQVMNTKESLLKGFVPYNGSQQGIVV